MNHVACLTCKTRLINLPSRPSTLPFFIFYFILRNEHFSVGFHWHSYPDTAYVLCIYPLTKDLSTHWLNQEIITAEILENSNIVDLPQRVFYLIFLSHFPIHEIILHALFIKIEKSRGKIDKIFNKFFKYLQNSLWIT